VPSGLGKARSHLTQPFEQLLQLRPAPDSFRGRQNNRLAGRAKTRWLARTTPAVGKNPAPPASSGVRARPLALLGRRQHGQRIVERRRRAPASRLRLPGGATDSRIHRTIAAAGSASGRPGGAQGTVAVEQLAAAHWQEPFIQELLVVKPRRGHAAHAQRGMEINSARKSTGVREV